MTGFYEIRFYNLADGMLTRTLKNPAAPVTHLFYPPNNQHLISSDRDGHLIVWDPGTRAVIARSNSLTGAITGLVIREDGLVSAWGDSTVWVLDSGKITLVATSTTSTGSILAASPNGQYLVVYKDDRFSLVDASNGKLLESLEGELQDLEYSPHSQAGDLFHYLALYSITIANYWPLMAEGGVWLHTLLDTASLWHHFEGTYTNTAVFSPDDCCLQFALDVENDQERVYDLGQDFPSHDNGH